MWKRSYWKCEWFDKSAIEFDPDGNAFGNGATEFGQKTIEFYQYLL